MDAGKSSQDTKSLLANDLLGVNEWIAILTGCCENPQVTKEPEIETNESRFLKFLWFQADVFADTQSHKPVRKAFS